MSRIFEVKDIESDMVEQADVCVVGSGAGGSVVAKELAERGLRVVLLEEGGAYSTVNYNQRPADMTAMMYRDGAANFALGLPPIMLPLGKCIGGTTTINSGTCFRTPEATVEKWVAEYGCQGLNYEDLIPYLDKVENEISVSELSEDVLGNIYKVVKRGAEKIGVECKPLRHNAKGCEGAGICQWGCPRGAKQSMEVSYVPKALKAGAVVYANCKVTKLDVLAGKVQGVHGVFVNPANNKKSHKIQVRAKVVCLAMGTMITPAFLLKQGLANSTSGWVGKGLSMHPCGRVVAEMDEEVNGHHGVSQGGYVDGWSHEGINLEGIFIPPNLLTAAMPGVGMAHKYNAKHYRNMAAFGAMICDSTRGRVFRGLLGMPFMAWYSMNREDARKLQKAVACTVEIFLAAGARRVFTGAHPMPVISNSDDLERFCKLDIKPWQWEEIFAFHPLGTCRMGNDPRKSVVNLNLESHEIKGLFIPDGSPFPTPLGVNPQVTIMTFATRAAAYIADNFESY